ncbi:hypothetical protein ACFRQM_04365 [Streptomyces sp. NPDC056831]|uniref:hypothetical protein n=1 Tax=Streptomyces sp. NPDC056831 TaxID=3345954 RepID=UPI003676F2A1
MRITLMTTEQRDQLAAALAQQNPAAPELVAATVAGVLHRGTSSASPIGRVFAGDVRAVAARLVEVERVLDTTRRTLARTATSDYHHSISDLLWELKKAGVGISDDELDNAEAAATAEAHAEALR